MMDRDEKLQLGSVAVHLLPESLFSFNSFTGSATLFYAASYVARGIRCVSLYEISGALIHLLIKKGVYLSICSSVPTQYMFST